MRWKLGIWNKELLQKYIKRWNGTSYCNVIIKIFVKTCNSYLPVYTTFGKFSWNCNRIYFCYPRNLLKLKHCYMTDIASKIPDKKQHLQLKENIVLYYWFLYACSPNLACCTLLAINIAAIMHTFYNIHVYSDT